MHKPDFFLQNVFFTTREFAHAANIDVTAASRLLHKMKKEGSLTLVTRGIWCQPSHPYFSPYGAVSYLLNNESGYVSFLSSLHRYDVISQIPSTIQIATTGHTRTLQTSIGVFEFFRLHPSMMRDGIYLTDGKIKYPIAFAEKALIDVIYISKRKGKRFRVLPELDTSQLQKKKILLFLHSVPKIAQKLVTEHLRKYKLYK